MISLIIFIIGVLVLPLAFIRIISPETIKKKPVFAGIIAAFFVLIGFVAAYSIFLSALSIAMIAFSSLLILPFLIKLLEAETVAYEKTYEKTQKSGLYSWFNPSNLSKIFERHNKLITFYIFFFFGMAVEYALLFAFLPPQLSDNAFQNQLQLIGPHGSFIGFYDIIMNNLQILIICFVFSVFYGAGSIFVLNYNASLVGVMYGSSLKTLIWATPVFYSNILSYLPHTILEILGYLLAAIAGGILFGLKEKNIKDASVIFALSLILIFIAGYVEIMVLNKFI